MKRIALAFIIVSLGLVASACKNPLVVTVIAQTLPVNKTLAWDANPVSDAVTNYTVSLDGTVIGSPVTPSQAVVFATAGAHVLTVTATNVWGTSPPTTLNVTVVVPATPKNLRLQ